MRYLCFIQQLSSAPTTECGPLPPEINSTVKWQDTLHPKSCTWSFQNRVEPFEFLSLLYCLLTQEWRMVSCAAVRVRGSASARDRPRVLSSARTQQMRSRWDGNTEGSNTDASTHQPPPTPLLNAESCSCDTGVVARWKPLTLCAFVRVCCQKPANISVGTRARWD